MTRNQVQARNAATNLSPYTLVSRNQDGTVTFAGPGGEQVRFALAPSDVTNQREQLDTYLGGYRPFGFGADLMAPIIPVNREKGDRRDLGTANAFERVDTKVGRHGAIQQVDLISELGQYHCEEYGLASFLAWQTENDAQDNFDPRKHIGEMLMWKLALDREHRVRDLLANTASWHSDNVLNLTGVANAKWDSGNAKNPRLDLHTVAKAMLMPPTDVFMNPDVAFHMLGDEEIRDFMRQMLGDSAPSPAVARGASAGDLDVVSFVVPGLIGDGNVAVHIIPAKTTDLASGSTEYIWADDVLILSNPPGQTNDGLRMASAVTYRTRGRSGTGIVTNEYVPQGRGVNSGTMFEVGFSDDELVSGPQAGALIKGVLA